MTDDTYTTERNRSRISRRGVLMALAAGATSSTIAAFATGDAPGPERVGLGGNSRESASAAFRYGAFAFAPSTVPLTEADI